MNRFGPDNNLPIQASKVVRLEVPANSKAMFSFHCEADWENAICIYAVGDYNKVHEAGNYARSRNGWTFTNDSSRPKALWISGWHKDGPPDVHLAWQQSPKQVFHRRPTVLVAGFEDAGDDDFDDISTTVLLERLS